MAGRFEREFQRLHYVGRPRRGIWARWAELIRGRRGELGIPGPYVEGSSGWLQITAVLECDEDFVLLNKVIEVVGKHFLVDHRGQVGGTRAIIVTDDPRSADLFDQVEQLGGETKTQDGWLITYASRARPR